MLAKPGPCPCGRMRVGGSARRAYPARRRALARRLDAAVCDDRLQWLVRAQRAWRLSAQQRRRGGIAVLARRSQPGDTTSLPGQKRRARRNWRDVSCRGRFRFGDRRSESRIAPASGATSEDRADGLPRPAPVRRTQPPAGDGCAVGLTEFPRGGLLPGTERVSPRLWGARRQTAIRHFRSEDEEQRVCNQLQTDRPTGSVRPWAVGASKKGQP